MSEVVGNVDATTSEYYDQVVRVEGIARHGDAMVITHDMVHHLEMAWVALGGIRGFYQPAEYPDFCQSCDETMRFLAHLTEKLQAGRQIPGGI